MEAEARLESDEQFDGAWLMTRLRIVHTGVIPDEALRAADASAKEPLAMV
jgi:hypothetical protein